MRDGRVILSRGYGVADLGTRQPLSPSDHLLRQGSISKLVTWLMVMQLAEEGKLDLDRDINAYLPFAIAPAFDRPITMRHLLTHSAGFAEQFMGVYGKPDGPLCETLRKHLPDRVNPPGERISYSNSGAGLAACVVERLTGKPFDIAARERVFAPVAMRSSTFAQPPEEPLRSRLASSYGASTQTPHGFEYIGVPPAGSLSASAEDMGRLLASLMRSGSGDGGRLISSRTLAEMLRLRKPLAPGLPAGFGLGFIVRQHRGITYVGHGGTTAAAITDMEMVPELGIGWYIGMTGLGLGGSAVGIRESLPGAVIAEFAPRMAPVRELGPSSAKDLEGSWLPARRYRSGPLKMSDLNLIGVRAEDDGSIRIDTVTDDLGRPRRWLPRGKDRFAEEASGAPLVLARDASGNVIRFASGLVNPVSDLERAPAWLAAALPLFGGSALVIVIAGLAIAIGGLIRRLRRMPERESHASVRAWRRGALAGVGFLFATLSGWFILIAIVSDDPYRLATAAVPLFILGFMAVLAPFAALPILGHAGVLLRQSQRTAGSWYALVGIAALICSALFYSLGLASLSTEF